MRKLNNMIGKKFNMLTVLEECKERKRGYKIYKCLCDCGNITYVRSSHLKNNNTKSCGCLHHKPNRLVHGKYKTRIYRIYHDIKSRCYNRNETAYKNYGARGIVVCDEWLDDFMNFYNWSTENGYNNSLTIDRINVDGDYEPNNCRWVTMKEQQNNRRNNVYLTCHGKTQTMSQWADELGIKKCTIKARRKYGWSDEECLFGKVKTVHKLYKYDYLTGQILKEYNTLQEASIDNNVTQQAISKSLRTDIIKYPRKDYYISDKPKPRWVIIVYDNETRLELGRYKTIKDAAVATGVNWQQIEWQIAKDLPFNDRRMGSTSLWFVRKTLEV